MAIISISEEIDSLEELPLLDLFTRLREAGLPLGIEEYRLLLRAFQEGFGTTDREALADLCKTLWVKSRDDEHLFNYHFNQLAEASFASSEKEAKPDVPFSEANEQAEDDPEGGCETPKSTSPAAAISSDLIEVEDEIQMAEAVQVASRRDDEVIPTRFTQTDEYFPVTRRQMKQSWRHLRRLVREGLPTEFDVEATIALISQQGLLLEPVLVPNRINRTELVLLIDYKGSMVPFHALGERLAETAMRGGRLGQAGIYYFHNCPTRFLYKDSARKRAEPISDVLRQFRSERTAVLIFSDAGAARGGFSEERLEFTQHFLNLLKQHVRYTAWLNPMAQERWQGTTAGEIAQRIPMFELSRQGLDRAIDVLRGKLTHLMRSI